MSTRQGGPNAMMGTCYPSIWCNLLLKKLRMNICLLKFDNSLSLNCCTFQGIQGTLQCWKSAVPRHEKHPATGMYILYKSHDTARFYTLATAKLELQFTLSAYSRINAAKTAPSDDSCLLRSGFKTSTSMPNLRAFHAETSAQSVL